MCGMNVNFLDCNHVLAQKEIPFCSNAMDSILYAECDSNKGANFAPTNERIFFYFRWVSLIKIKQIQMSSWLYFNQITNQQILKYDFKKGFLNTHQNKEHLGHGTKNFFRP